jgi:hypothetical protein
MLYALLAYHEEDRITALSEAEDAALMEELHKVHDALAAQRRLGPAARLGATADARTLRRGRGQMVVDGPFAETKEALLGFYVIEAADMDAALATAADLARANPTAVYEVRPITLYLPGALPVEASADA